MSDTSRDGVLFVLNTLAVGGMERITVALSRQLAERGRFRPVVACLADRGPLADGLTDAGVELHANLLRHKLDRKVIGRLRAIFEQSRIGVAVIMDMGGDRMFWTCVARGKKRGPGRPAMVMAPRSMPDPHHRRIEWANRRLIGRLDAVAVLGDRHADALAEVEHLPRERMVPIVSGLDNARLAALADARNREHLRHELHAGDGDVVVMCVANPRPIKPVDLFLETAQRLGGRDNLRFVLVGDGPDRDHVAIRLAEMDLQKPHFAWLGRRDDVADLWQAADVGVCCAPREGTELLSVAMLEAMAAGVAFVSTRVGEHPAVVGDDERGLLVNPTVDAMADAVARLAGDPAMRERLGETAAGHVRRHHTAAAMADAFEAMLARVAAE